jgi:dimethylamine monooxygenase subunit A
MSDASSSLAELFPDGDYRFHLTLRRGEPRDFFAPQESTGHVLAERARWLAKDPERYAAVLPEGEPLLSEFRELAATWGVPSPVAAGAAGSSAIETLRHLGATLEPDVLFLSADPDGRFRLRGGALCFPTGWSLEEKLGHTLDFIHGIVPGLNPALGASIHQFLSKLKPGAVFLRDNWGIAASPELNLHPARGIAPPGVPIALDRLWLRVERQALMTLPRTRGIVFGIRIELHRLDSLAGTPAAAGLSRALTTIPLELAVYKRVDVIGPQIVGLL